MILIEISSVYLYFFDLHLFVWIYDQLIIVSYFIISVLFYIA